MPANEIVSSRTLEAVFKPAHVILDYKDLAYNPCNDVIFPSLIATAGRLRNPVDAYYMYYAPHDPPGGICLAHAPSIDGPWKEHPGNPLVANVWEPHHCVSHVSSPHALWVDEEARLFVYYHGDNDQTHYATSTDGIHFTYGGVALDQTSYADYVRGVYDRVFYGRVFAHRLPSKGSKYVLLVARSSDQGLHQQGIYLSWSADARNWSAPTRILQRPAGSRFACSPCLFTLQDRHFVAYHAECGDVDAGLPPYADIFVDEFDTEFVVRKPLGRLVDHRIFGPANPRVADPLIVVEGVVVNLIVSIDKRLNQRLALAKADLRDLARALSRPD